MKVHRAIRFNSSPYVAGYIANNTARRKQLKHDDAKKAFNKLFNNVVYCALLVNNAPYKKTIKNVARLTDIKMLNELEKAQKLAETRHWVDIRVFDGQLAPPKENVMIAVAEEKRQQEALVGI